MSMYITYNYGSFVLVGIGKTSDSLNFQWNLKAIIGQDSLWKQSALGVKLLDVFIVKILHILYLKL